ncbi:MAG: carboxypeptidase regulatory-like domain-containing protein [Planctomycetes bacterium]|nr:carboxypeptidase regulatory-like domain-containing protein [Planctomycetota bacterium]
MYTKLLNRTPLVAFFLFVMMSLVVNHCTTYGQTPTATPSVTPEPTPAATGVIIGNVVDAVSFTGIADAVVSTDPGGYSTVTGPDGSFVLEVPAGSYTLIASAAGYTPSSQPITVEAGVATQAVLLLQSETTGGGSFIIGFVNDEDDDALAGVTVTLDGAEYSDSVITDEDGAFEFRDLSAGDYTLTLEKDGFQTYTQNISLGDGEILVLDTIILEVIVKAALSGYVVDINGDPVENVRIRARGVKTGYKNTTATDADGFFEFADLDADTYIIVARKKGYKRAKQTISLGDGESQEIEIELKKTSKRIIKASAR